MKAWGFWAKASSTVSCVVRQVIRPTPQGRWASCLAKVSSSPSQSGSPYPPPTKPNPPALDTAAAKRPPETRAIGAETIGYCRPKVLVSAVLIATVAPSGFSGSSDDRTSPRLRQGSRFAFPTTSSQIASCPAQHYKPCRSFFSNAEPMPLKARFWPCLSLNQTDYELYQKVAEPSPAERAPCAAIKQHPRRIS